MARKKFPENETHKARQQKKGAFSNPKNVFENYTNGGFSNTWIFKRSPICVKWKPPILVKTLYENGGCPYSRKKFQREPGKIDYS